MNENISPIPKIIHQTWRDENIAEHSSVAEESQQSWIKNHPDWEYHLWTDDQLEPFIAANYSWFLPTWKTLNLKIKRVDAVRYCWLHKLGGMYADLDFVCIKNIGPLLNGIEVASYKSREAENKRWQFAGNAWMASVAGHPVWLRMLEHIRDYPEPEGTDMFAVLRHTGPMGFGKVVEEYLGKHTDPAVKVFNSSMIGNENEPPVEYAYHARTQNWGEDWSATRQNTTKHSVVTKVKTSVRRVLGKI